MDMWDYTVRFHGHACCILAVGYRAALLAKARLSPSEHDEIIAQVGTADCSTDALQTVLGCTLGKRTLTVKDYGKHKFIVAIPGRAVCITLKPGTLTRTGPDFVELMEKVAAGTASSDEEARFYEWQTPLMQYILSAPAENLFTCKDSVAPPNSQTFSFRSVQCSACGEAVFISHAKCRGADFFCPECPDHQHA
ncbi:FmdE family protein [Sporomusa sp. GT1]|uniref:FmdE family protein n=1 Tax=Sporomusa sp. GT1 TaxID=1534747 RepID=UPI001665D340|nr:FmdE family protein [Sporomusa sp. GT1]